MGLRLSQRPFTTHHVPDVQPNLLRTAQRMRAGGCIKGDDFEAENSHTRPAQGSGPGSRPAATSASRSR